MGIFSRIFSQPKEDELVAVFDIGSASVGGALFICRKAGGPKIILSLREPIILENEVTPERFLFLTTQALQVVASRVCTAGLGAPKKIFCVLSSPWYASQTRMIKLEKNTPFTFTHKLADDLIKKEIGLFHSEHLSKNTRSHKVRHFELKSMKTMLNGYHTPRPLGKKAKELEIAIFVSLSGEHVLGQIEEVIFRHFHRRSVKYSSFAMAFFTVVRDLFPEEEDFLLIDIGGEMTDISMIKKSVLKESASFPLGHNFMIRRAASLLGLSLSETKSFISLYKDRHLESGAERKLEQLMSKLKKEWLKNFQESLANLSDDISIPKNIFLAAAPDLAPFFRDIIKSEEFNQYSLTEGKFKVKVIDTQALYGILDFEENTTRDSFLTIESVYINRFLC